MELIIYTLICLVCVSIYLYLRKTNQPHANFDTLAETHKSKNKKRSGKNNIQSFRPIVKINDRVQTSSELACPEHNSLPETNTEQQTLPIELPDEFQEFTLTTQFDSITEKHVKEMLNKVGKPHPLLSSLCMNTSDSKELLEIIKKDPELVAKVINVANSPLFGLSNPITNLNHAMMFLGVIEVKNIATNFAVKESLQFENDTQQRVYEKIWSAGFLAGCILVELAKELNIDNAAQLSTRCQLSYLGDLGVLFGDVDITQLYSEQSSFFERLSVIQDTYGVSQVMIASKLTENWGLPSQITESMAKNLQPFKNNLIGEEIDKKHSLLCYLSCRIAELLIFNEDTKILNNSVLSWKDTDCIEFVYTQEQLDKLGLLRLNYVLNSVAFKRKIIQYTSALIQR